MPWRRGRRLRSNTVARGASPMGGMDNIRFTSWCPVHSEMLSLRIPGALRLKLKPSPSNLRYLLKVTLLSVLTLSPTMSAPATKSGSKGDPPRWVNPCGIPGHVFDPERDMNGAPDVHISETYVSIMRSARSAMDNAVDVKKTFLANEFPGADIEESTASYSQQWLPKIPKANEATFRSINQSEALRKSFEYLQYFAVGIEQIVLDQTLHDGKYLGDFRRIEEDLTQVLCQLQMGMFLLKIHPNSDVLRDVMSHEYRDVTVRSSRNLRDFLILRDFIKATSFISQLFAYMNSKLPE